MRDIFNREIQDFDIVSFPFIEYGKYYNSKSKVHLSYGVVKGNRVYLLNDAGDLIYKIINSPEKMTLLINSYELPALPSDVIERIKKIRELMSAKLLG